MRHDARVRPSGGCLPRTPQDGWPRLRARLEHATVALLAARACFRCQDTARFGVCQRHEDTRIVAAPPYHTPAASPWRFDMDELWLEAKGRRLRHRRRPATAAPAALPAATSPCRRPRRTCVIPRHLLNLLGAFHYADNCTSQPQRNGGLASRTTHAPPATSPPSRRHRSPRRITG